MSLAQKILPFVTQYHLTLPNLKDTLMGKWHLIGPQMYAITMFATLGRQLNLSNNLVTTEILKTIFETCHRLQSLSPNNSRFHSIGPWLERRVDQVETLIFLDLRNASGLAAGIEDILQKAYNLKCLVKVNLSLCIAQITRRRCVDRLLPVKLFISISQSKKLD